MQGTNTLPTLITLPALVLLANSVPNTRFYNPTSLLAIFSTLLSFQVLPMLVSGFH